MNHTNNDDKWYRVAIFAIAIFACPVTFKDVPQVSM
jgi:hypothetical protein